MHLYLLGWLQSIDCSTLIRVLAPSLHLHLGYWFMIAGINCVAVSDAGLALTGAEDGSLRISSTATGQQRILATLQGGCVC
jgi:hypothetical protein